jgi:hypothetical protein
MQPTRSLGATTQVCHDANVSHIWETFASPRTPRSLCVTPLEQDADAFFDRANTIAESVCIASLQIP